MVKRIKAITSGGNYFASPKQNIQFISSGSKLLDLALGGGWCEGRVSNIVGDKSSGKSLICIEASANFILKHPNGLVKYREAEAAFDIEYARALGMPIESVDFGEPLETIEDLFEDLSSCVKTKTPTLYICDSLDALSDRAEMGRDMDAGTYGAEKAKKLSQLFRRLIRDMSSSKVTLLIVSQVRDKIGITFGHGPKTTRSGGRALDFYASQVLYLTEIGKIPKTINNIKRPFGIKIKAKCTKNKISLPFREAEFKIIFGWGVDDLESCLEWLGEAGGLEDLDVSKTKIKDYLRKINDMSNTNYRNELKLIYDVVEKHWYRIENSFLPTRGSKYAT